MNLRKSDKIIALVGVIIIIIAGIGIFFYASTEEEPVKIPTMSKEKTFYVTWTKETGETMIDGSAQKTYNEPFTILAPTGSVLTNVDFRLTWQDDHVTGFILKRFQDTLTAEISLEGGEPQKDSTKGGCKNRSISFSANELPMIDSLEANDTYEASEKIEEMIFGQDTASFDVKVTVKTGEKIRRPLKFFMDKGNSFKFEVVYEYYYPYIEDGYEEDYDETIEEEGYSALGEFYRNLCYGRGMI